MDKYNVQEHYPFLKAVSILSCLEYLGGVRLMNADVTVICLSVRSECVKWCVKWCRYKKSQKIVFNFRNPRISNMEFNIDLNPLVSNFTWCEA